MFNPLQIPVRILQTLILGHEASTELAHINASTQRWLDEQPVTDAQPDAVDLKRILDERIEYRAEAKQLGKDAGAFHAALTEIAEIIECGGVSCGELPGKVRALIAGLRAEVQQLRADVVRLTTAHDARDDEALKWTGIAGRAAKEIEQLRADLAHARNQLPGTPGQTVTLHLENGTTTTGRLEVHHNQRTVRVADRRVIELPGDAIELRPVDAPAVAMPAPVDEKARAERWRSEAHAMATNWHNARAEIERLQADVVRLTDELTAMVDADMAEGWQRVSDEMEAAAQQPAPVVDRKGLLDFLVDLYLTQLDVDSAPQQWPRLTAEALISAGLVRTVAGETQ